MREIEESTVRAFEDAFVETAREAGAPGARSAGGDFGGCAIALVAADEAGTLAGFALRGFEEKGFDEPAFYMFGASAGAEVVG